MNVKTAEEARRARNGLREKLWADDQFAHRWMCHPNEHCADGCDVQPSAKRAAFYSTEIESHPAS